MVFQTRSILLSERDYKEKAARECSLLLNEETIKCLLESGNYSEVVNRALSIIKKTNLIFLQERIVLFDNLKDSGNHKLFAESLYKLMYAPEKNGAHFNSFVEVLGQLNSCKWTIATYFLFLMAPSEHIFVKPRNIQHTAKVFLWRDPYRSEPSWETYKRIYNFVLEVQSSLRDNGLCPNDLIDVQSFMWLIQQ